MNLKSDQWVNNRLKGSNSGFTLVEVLIALAVLGLFFVAISNILQKILENISASRVRTTALELAQQKMELVRNLPYNNIGTVNGVPNGAINQNESIMLNNHEFLVSTGIIYIDDPYDGLAPADTVNADYKRIQITINWSGVYPSREPITLITNITPRHKETDIPGGTLSVQVFNSLAQPVQNATVSIDNSGVTPEIHIQSVTDAAGTVKFPGSPACIECYRVSATKYGYSTDRTYSASEVASPVQTDASVNEGNVTNLSLSIDEVSTLTVRSYNQSYQPVANVSFILRGQKIIGYDTNDDPVYKFTRSTNTGGYTVTVSALEWDIYDLDFSNSAHTLAGSNPLLPLALPAKTNIILPVVVVPKSNASQLISVVDAFNAPQASASVRLKNDSLGYDLTKITPSTGSADFGQVFFNSLTNGIYDYLVNLTGFNEATGSVLIDTHIRKTVKLESL